ncbi:uncharacterized protein METZ01_LOCUS262640 [marine metagenome]|uniref:Uncharacterized protein n=1 Tax=marine metagenome TaxID=408172 RepID=A0A382JD14_9ZZZZ
MTQVQGASNGGHGDQRNHQNDSEATKNTAVRKHCLSEKSSKQIENIRESDSMSSKRSFSLTALRLSPDHRCIH